MIIGSGKDGLPIILGNVENPAAPGTTPPAGTAGAGAAPGSAPAPAGKTPPPGATPPITRGKPTGEATPPTSDQTAATAPDANEAQPASSGPLSLPEVQAILSRISGALHPFGSDTNSEAKPKP